MQTTTLCQMSAKHCQFRFDSMPIRVNGNPPTEINRIWFGPQSQWGILISPCFTPTLHCYKQRYNIQSLEEFGRDCVCVTSGVGCSLGYWSNALCLRLSSEEGLKQISLSFSHWIFEGLLLFVNMLLCWLLLLLFVVPGIFCALFLLLVTTRTWFCVRKDKPVSLLY